MSGPTFQWRLLLRVKNRAKADRKVEEVREALAINFEVITSERYWKDQALWDCTFQTYGTPGRAAEAAFDCLVLACRLGSGWYLSGPGHTGRLEHFEGVFDVRQSGKSHVLGLEWASFSLLRGADDA